MSFLSHPIASSHHRGKRYLKRREKKKHYSFFGVGRHTTKVTKYFDLLREGTGGEGQARKEGGWYEGGTLQHAAVGSLGSGGWSYE
jgi:hypothetical protein